MNPCVWNMRVSLFCNARGILQDFTNPPNTPSGFTGSQCFPIKLGNILVLHILGEWLLQRCHKQTCSLVTPLANLIHYPPIATHWSLLEQLFIQWTSPHSIASCRFSVKKKIKFRDTLKTGRWSLFISIYLPISWVPILDLAATSAYLSLIWFRNTGSNTYITSLSRLSKKTPGRMVGELNDYKRDAWL